METTLNEIQNELNNKTNESWSIDNNRVFVIGADEGSDYSISIEDNHIVLRTTGMTETYNSINELVSQLVSWQNDGLL